MTRGRKRSINSEDSISGSSSNSINNVNANIITHIVLPPRRMITRGLLNGTSPALSELAESLHEELNVSCDNNDNSIDNNNHKTISNSNNALIKQLSSADQKDNERKINGSKSRAQAVQNNKHTSSKSVCSKQNQEQELLLEHKQERQEQHASHNVSSPMSPRVLLLGGVLRCVCNAFLISSQETLLECSKCRNWCHPACVGVDHAELRHFLRTKTFVCPYCTGEESSNFHPPMVVLHAGETQTSVVTSSNKCQGKEDLKEIAEEADNEKRTSRFQAKSKSKSVKGAKQQRESLSLEEHHQQPRLLSSEVNGNVIKNYCYNNNSNSSSSISEKTQAPVTLTTTTTYTLGRHPPAPRQIPLRLREVADHLPETNASHLSQLLQQLHAIAHDLNYDVIDLPLINSASTTNNNITKSTIINTESGSRKNTLQVNNNVPTELTDADVAQCVECCEAAIRDATFSENYPAYCLKEVRSHLHPYVQGTLLRCRRERKIRAMILSNGMDVYGNLKPTITQLKSAINRKCVDLCSLTNTMQACLGIADVSDFVHITLSATHVRHQRKGLAKLLMSMELLKWALRGRTRAFLNMAIEKKLVEVDATNSDSEYSNINKNGNNSSSSSSSNNNNNSSYKSSKNKSNKSNHLKVEYGSPPASRRLYHTFNFEDVYPRYDELTQSERWTAKEADMGRVMINLEFVPSAVRVAECIIAQHTSSQKSLHNATQPESKKTQLQSKQVKEEESAHVHNVRSSILSLKHDLDSVKKQEEEEEEEYNKLIECEPNDLVKVDNDNAKEAKTTINENITSQCCDSINDYNNSVKGELAFSDNNNNCQQIDEPKKVKKEEENVKHQETMAQNTVSQLINGRSSLSLYKRRRGDNSGCVNNNDSTNTATNDNCSILSSADTTTTTTTTTTINNSEQLLLLQNSKLSKTVHKAKSVKLEAAAATAAVSSLPTRRRSSHTNDVKTSNQSSTTRFSRPFSLTRMKNTKELLSQHEQQQEEEHKKTQ